MDTKELVERLRGYEYLTSWGEPTSVPEEAADALEAQAERIKVLDESNATLNAAITYAINCEMGDGLVFLRDWSEGDPETLNELDAHRAALKGATNE